MDLCPRALHPEATCHPDRLSASIRTSPDRADGLVSSRAAAERLQVSPSLVNLWVRHGVLLHDQRVPASKVWVRLDDADVARLTGAAPQTDALPSFRSVLQQTGLAPNELWQKVTEGHYLPYRVRQGQTWQWRLKDLRTTPPPTPASFVLTAKETDSMNDDLAPATNAAPC